MYTLTADTSTFHEVIQAPEGVETSPNNGKFVYEGASPRFYIGETVWFQVHLLHPPGWEYVSETFNQRCKFMRMQTFSPLGENNGYNDIYVGNPNGGEVWRYIYEGKPQWVDFGTVESLPQDNTQWEEYQMCVTLDTLSQADGGKGRVLFWKDDELLVDITNKQTLLDPLGYMNEYEYNGYWSNEGAEKTQRCYWGYSAVTNRAPDYTDAFGNPKLPPRNV